MADIAETALDDLTHRIASLDDEPQMSAKELKQYFDTSPQELMNAHNALVSALTATTAAAQLGFTPARGIPADTIQGALEQLSARITALEEA